MLKSSKKLNQKGLTLVEVLAALVILGIVFIGIMTVFPQMTIFNEKTETKLDTMNLARQEMNSFTESDVIYTQGFPVSKTRLKLYVEAILATSFTQQNIDAGFTDNVNSLSYELSKNGITYLYEIFVIPDLGSGGETETSLYKVILDIKSETNTPVSKTYGYLEIKK